MALSEDETVCFSIIYWVVPEAIVPTIFPKYFWEQMGQTLLRTRGDDRVAVLHLSMGSTRMSDRSLPELKRPALP